MRATISHGQIRSPLGCSFPRIADAGNSDKLDNVWQSTAVQRYLNHSLGFLHSGRSVPTQNGSKIDRLPHSNALSIGLLRPPDMDFKAVGRR